MNYLESSGLQLERLRFIEDVQTSKRRPDSANHNKEIARYAYASVEVSQFLTPLLEAALGEACSRLSIDRSQVVMFVQQQSDVQASCILTDGKRCILTVTSGLVNLLEDDEIRFVVGHELGHYVFEHTGSMTTNESDTEIPLLQRAAEISADRCGLVACGDLDSAIKAMIKTASGLDSKHLRYDSRQFMSAANSLQGMTHMTQGATHPALAVRARALVWFHMHVSSREKEMLETVDSRVLKDLGKFVDGDFRSTRSALRIELIKWKCAELILHHPEVNNDWVPVLSTEIGSENAREIKIFLDDENCEGVSKDVEHRVGVVLDEIRDKYSVSAAQIEEEAIGCSYRLLDSIKGN